MMEMRGEVGKKAPKKEMDDMTSKVVHIVLRARSFGTNIQTHRHPVTLL